MSKELGTLAIVVLKAKNLHDRHSFYKQDPYAKITLNGKTLKTEVDVKGGQHPEWDAEFRFPVYAAKSDSSRQLEVTCWRAEPREHEEIGKGKVDISDTLKTGEFDDWVAINDVTGTYRGEIYLEMTFFASGPQPLERRPSKLPPQERLHHLKQGAVPAGGNLTVPGGANVHHQSTLPPQIHHQSTLPPQVHHQSILPPQVQPLPTVLESKGPEPLPPNLRPGAEHGPPNGHGRRASEYSLLVNSGPPHSLAPGRPPAHRNDSNPFRTGQHTRASSDGYNIPYTPPRESYPPPRPSYSPPRHSQNSYVSEPAPPSIPGSGYFPSPYITVDSTPPELTPYSSFSSGSSYGAPQHSPPQVSSPPIQKHTGAPSFPFVSPQPPSPNFHPPQSSSPYSVPQSTYPPSQPGYPQPQSTYPQPQSTYPPPSQPGFPIQAPPQFPSHQQSFHIQPQGSYGAYDHTSPPLGPPHRPFFPREDSVGELPDPALMHRYSSPLPLPNDGKPSRSHSPFPVPSVPPVAPPPHPTPSPYSPSAEYERELGRRREQEERDAELARQLDFELNLGGP